MSRSRFHGDSSSLLPRLCGGEGLGMRGKSTRKRGKTRLQFAQQTAPLPETLNGLNVQRYHFTQEDLADPSFGYKQAAGDVWVSTDSNNVVQYIISATLTTLPPLPNAHLMDEGQLTLRYTLSDINADVTITPPEQPGNNVLTLLPLLPDARLDAVFPALIEYTSAISPVSATLFYQEQLVNAGWTEETTTFFNEKARLSFSKDDEKISFLWLISIWGF